MLGNMIGSAPAMQGCYDLIGRVAPTDAACSSSARAAAGSSRVIHEPAKGPSVRRDELRRGVADAHQNLRTTRQLHGGQGFFERAHGGTLFWTRSPRCRWVGCGSCARDV
jgi:hypothetical protein